MKLTISPNAHPADAIEVTEHFLFALKETAGPDTDLHEELEGWEVTVYPRDHVDAEDDPLKPGYRLVAFGYSGFSMGFSESWYRNPEGKLFSNADLDHEDPYAAQEGPKLP
jgi:hypothetical protein